MFKKGDLVTRIASWDHTGTVYVTHYVVSSWGKKQATLVKVNDGSNTKFRAYTKEAGRLQGIHSCTIVPTADYSEELGLYFAARFIADEHSCAKKRFLSTRAHYSDPNCVPYVGTRQENLVHEQGVFDRHNAVAWKAAVQVMQ